MELFLYYKKGCPYCEKVFKYLDKLKIDLPLKDMEDGEIRNELISIGGKAQVPCLVIDGSAMYESDDIIEWLSENIDNLGTL